MSSSVQEVIADQSLEEWTFLGEDGEELEGEETRDLTSASIASSSVDRSSDIEVIEHDSDDETVLNESTNSVSMLQRGESIAQGMDWSFGTDDDELDLNLEPGPKAYTHHPNESVNFWLNLSVLVAVASVMGMGIGNYVGSYVNWPQQLMKGQPSSHLKNLQQQLDDCLHEKELLSNGSAVNQIREAIDGHDEHHFGMTTRYAEGPDTRERTLQRNLQVQRQSPNAVPEIRHTPRDRHTRHSSISAPSSQQVIIRKSSAIESVKGKAKTEDNGDVSEISVHHFDGSVVIETSTTISFRSKAKDSSNKRRGGYALESEVKILLLLTEKGTSKPVFFSHDDKPERQRVMRSIFKPFLADTFRSNAFTVWTESAAGSQQMEDWKGIPVIPSDKNPNWTQLRKTTKFFWSNLRKKVLKNWKGGEVSEFKSRLMDVLLLLPESHFQTMFEKMQSKIRRSIAKTSNKHYRSHHQ